MVLHSLVFMCVWVDVCVSVRVAEKHLMVVQKGYLYFQTFLVPMHFVCGALLHHSSNQIPMWIIIFNFKWWHGNGTEEICRLDPL